MQILKYLILTPAFQKWHSKVQGTSKNSWRSYQDYFTRVDQVLCLLDIVWPEFEERDGMILRMSNMPDDWFQFKQQADQSGWSKSEMEYVINHLHIADLFLNDPDRDKIDNSIYQFLAFTLADAWECKLKMLFPNMNFAVGVSEENIDPEVYAYLLRY